MTYYRFVNPDKEKGDVTKNCGLDGTEIDANFWELEQNEIVKLEVDGDEIILTTYGGKTFSANIYAGVERDMVFAFDRNNGVLTITAKDQEDRIVSGFVTMEDVNTAINESEDEMLETDIPNLITIMGQNDVVNIYEAEDSLEMQRKNGDVEVITKGLVHKDEVEELISQDVVDINEDNANLTLTRNDGSVKTFMQDVIHKEETVSMVAASAESILQEMNAAMSEQMRLFQSLLEQKIKETIDNMNVNTDLTLQGDGFNTPLGIAQMHKTGLFRVVDLEGDELPSVEDRKVGERYLIDYKMSAYGSLYNLNGVKRIEEMLEAQNSDWHVATVEDWNNMLNALEPETDRNHGERGSSIWTGKVAGDRIKTTDPSVENWNGGVMNGFGAYPAGGAIMISGDKPTFVQERYSVGDTQNGYAFGIWWTMPKPDATESVTKAIYDDRDVADKGKVRTEIRTAAEYYPIRLVKKYNGNNYSEMEDILGCPTPCAVMPEVVANEENTESYNVWTAVNVAIVPVDTDGVEVEEGELYFSFKDKEGVDDKFLREYYIFEVNSDMSLSTSKLMEREGVYVNKDKFGGVDLCLKILYKGELRTPFAPTQTMEDVQNNLENGGIVSLQGNVGVNNDSTLIATTSATLNLNDNVIEADGTSHLNDDNDAGLVVTGADTVIEINAN